MFSQICEWIWTEENNNLHTCITSRLPLSIVRTQGKCKIFSSFFETTGEKKKGGFEKNTRGCKEGDKVWKGQRDGINIW
jgi:hypothetical protein